MSKLKAIASLYALAALTTKPNYYQEVENIKVSEDDIHKMNGLKKFTYGENYLYALNQKNADKKAKKKGWL